MSYLIKDTTSLERKKIVEKALSISLSDAVDPSDYAIVLAQKYIDGELELEEIQKMIIDKYKNKEEVV